MIFSVSVYSRHSSESSFILSTGTSSAEADDESNYGLWNVVKAFMKFDSLSVMVAVIYSTSP